MCIMQIDDKEKKLIETAFINTNEKIQKFNYILCSISGGADSDIMLDICSKCSNNDKIKYVFCNTGLEYEATKRHLKWLEEKYNISIETVNAIKPIPISCRDYGVPFLSKNVSEMMYRLQLHNFKWEDKPFDVLIQEYPKCKSALEWWCNMHKQGSPFNIDNNKLLKAFIIANPPTFRISNKCCDYSKKIPIKKYSIDNNIELEITGVRKAEGGVRQQAYKSCFSEPTDKKNAKYRPIFWFLNSTKKIYEKLYNITHSDCYTKYGMTRTGCAGCPYGNNFEEELEICKQHEPKLYKALINIFGVSYDYTRKYKAFIKSHKNK